MMIVLGFIILFILTKGGAFAMQECVENLYTDLLRALGFACIAISCIVTIVLIALLMTNQFPV